METGRSTNTSPQSFPAVRHLVWALVAGTALVAGGLRDSEPPRPPDPPAVAAPAPTVAPAPGPAPAWATARPAPPAPAPPYTAARSPSPRPPALVRRPSGPPAAPVPRTPARPAPLRPPPPTAGPLPAGPAPVPLRPVPAAPRPEEVRPLSPSPPVRLRIPQLKVDSPMVKLGLDAAGALKTPPDDDPVLSGWYADGTVPGSVGTAITTGHVDTRLGPGVFFLLGALREGATVEIVRADLSTAVFTVYAVEVYDKKTFPDEKVYGPSDRPELRVITCGGKYDKKSGYADNVVVFATLTGSR